MKPMGVWTAASMGLALGMATAAIGQELKLSDCPAAVQKTIEAETRGARIEAVRKEKEDDETIYWTDALVAGKTYAIGVLEDGTLTEMNLALADAELTLDHCPSPVQATFRREAFGEPVRAVGKDMKYGATIYEAAVTHRGKSYEIVVAEDGTLVEKALIIEDEEVELSKCPAAVQSAFHSHARDGQITSITRSTGIIRPTFEAEIQIKGKVYLVEVGDNGVLISKSLEAAEE